MLVSGFPAGPWGTNCFVVADGPGSECLIIDPGYDAMTGIEQIVEKHRLHPAAVVLTHGHLDHTWSVLPVCRGSQVAAYIHPGDRAMLSDPSVGISAQMAAAVEQMSGGTLEFAEPDEVRELVDGGTVELLGISLTVRHAPGHTPGSVVFGAEPTADLPPLLFSGDLLFAGSIGRTDLPGGDTAAMMQSLATVLPEFTDETVVLPGHGGQTTMAQERATNPYLQPESFL